MRMSPRSEQRFPQVCKTVPDPVIEVTSLDLLMMLEDLGGSADLDDINTSLRRPS
jgi:hypothetical protein